LHDLAVGPASTLYAVWQGFSEPWAPWSGQGGGTPVFSWRPLGGEWQPSVEVRTIPHREIGQGATGGYQPQVAVDADGRVVVVWEDDEETVTEQGAATYHLLYSVWDPATETWSENLPVVPDDPAGLSSASQGLMIGSADGIHLIGAIPAAGDDEGSLLAWTTLPSGESAWTDPAPIVAPDVQVNDPKLHATVDGMLLVTWSISGHSVGSAFLPAGANGWIALPPAFLGRRFFSYDSALLDDGRLAVVMEDDVAERGIPAMVTIYTPGGPGSTSPVAATPNPRPDVVEPAPEPVYRGNAAHTGAQPGPAPTGELVELWRRGPEEWQADVVTPPTLVNGVLYAGTGKSRTDDGGLIAVDVATGDLIWSFATATRVATAPAVADGIVYVVDEDSHLYAVNAATGDLVWQGQSSLHTSPTVVDGVLYVAEAPFASREDVVALDARTGDEIWRFTGLELIQSTATVVDGVVFVGGSFGQEGDAFPGMFYALDAETGEQLWQVKTGKDVDTIPAVYGGMVYFDDDQGVLYAVDIATGEVRWQTEPRTVNEAPAVTDEVVYGSGGNGVLHAFDSLTGVEIWSVDTGQTLDAPAVVDGVLYVVSRSQLLVFDAATGDEVARVERLPLETANIESAPLIVDGVVYVNGSGVLLALGGDRE
jgi:outer membrane protein assembly factor BamB